MALLAVAPHPQERVEANPPICLQRGVEDASNYEVRGDRCFLIRTWDNRPTLSASKAEREAATKAAESGQNTPEVCVAANAFTEPFTQRAGHWERVGGQTSTPYS